VSGKLDILITEYYTEGHFITRHIASYIDISIINYSLLKVFIKISILLLMDLWQGATLTKKLALESWEKLFLRKLGGGPGLQDLEKLNNEVG